MNVDGRMRFLCYHQVYKEPFYQTLRVIQYLFNREQILRFTRPLSLTSGII
jgi:hypothetical protein